jgi:predicted Zn finger-like uncharacterized protein
VYTQCPDCTTVFRVTADALRTAQGNVRCGVCSTSFNALENLSEEPFRAGPESEYTPALEDTITVEEMPGTEDIELSTVAEAVSTSEPAEDESFEFDGDIEDIDRLFVEMPETELQHMAAAARAGEQPPVPTIDPGAIAASLTIGQHDLARTDENPILVLDESDEIVAAPDEFQPNPFETPRILIPDEMRKGLAEEAAASAINAPNFDEPDSEEGPRRWPWAMGTAILMLSLVAQVVNGQRDQLLRKPTIGPLLARIYSLVGLSFSAPTDLASYELRQWGAASDATQAGRLLLRASIVNRANYAQPYPLLRLALQDRFGTTVGVRDIQPVDYLPGSGAGNLLEPGQRADAEIRIVDPGKDAVGFEIDVCLSMTDGVRCANETTPATP